MCSRYQSSTHEEMSRAIKQNLRFIFKESQIKPMIYPGYDAPIIRDDGDGLVAEARFWGFVARFPGKKEPGKMIEKIMQNAVSETVDEKRTFSGAWKKNQRCLIPAKTFLEPIDKVFTPIQVKNEPLVMMAGLFGETTHKEKKHEAFTMLTCEPNEFMLPFHSGEPRMPVILHERDWDEWLSPDTTPDQAIKLCRPFSGKLELAK